MENNAQDRIIPVTSVDSGDLEAVTNDVHYLTTQIVNVCFYGLPGTKNDWVLIDAGMPRSADTILEAAEKLFGENNPPKAIILTHGHFDHVGALVELVERWDVNVFAHELEMPYLSGVKNYPEPDPTVDGGLLAKASKLYPNEAIKLGSSIKALPLDGTVPDMEGWRWVHTPGHTPGHISLFREADRTLIAGDAFVTVKQESLYKVVTQKKEISGPPRYLTPDWIAARKSVEDLFALHPARAITGHGRPMEGEELEKNLDLLVRDFERIVVPEHGKFVDGE
ncbi:MBL fold metallo-hydrolase [Bacillus sp. ISL-37]|uniref:MBL fold metallo-hydrolase n=1 Tax=Bacillus sp. ISL-37 TaxID=2819123 RepID=UPI001BE7DA17|nr:MBL fold metallo-hydrolase [Bacillus sp. ISL-37]MBT2685347.1 MBL fold metallo-hydrolase [Bacillus sp. ISL-37]